MSAQGQAGFVDRIVSALSYFSAGWAGIIYFVILYINKKTPSRFACYNVFQSIFISILFFLIAEVFKLVCNLLLVIPFVKVVVTWFLFIFNRPFILHYSIIDVFVIVLFFYMAVWSFAGKYPKVPFVSKIISGYVR